MVREKKGENNTFINFKTIAISYKTILKYKHQKSLII